MKRYEFNGPPGTRYWTLSVWYDLDKCTWGEPDKEFTAAIGRPDGAGTGFGQRDMDWSFVDEASARTALSKVKKIIGRKKGFHTSLDEITEDDEN